MAWNNFDENNDLGALLGRRDPVENTQPEYIFEADVDEPEESIEDPIEHSKKPEIQKGSKNKDEIKKFKYNKTAKLSQEEAEQLECVKDAFGYSTDSEAIRWFILKAWEIYGVDVEKTAKKIRKIRAQQ